jgi:hypothetical protein
MNTKQEFAIKHLEGIVKFREEALETAFASLKENFCYQLAWTGEDMFMNQYRLDHYKAILADLKGKNAEDVFQYWIGRFKTYISHPYNVRENSTGVLHREASTWKYMATMTLLEEVEGWYDSLKENKEN